MRQPHSLKEAKEIFREEKLKLSTAVSSVFGSRALMAVLATFAFAFAAHLIWAPERLPTVGGVSLAQVGLPPLDFGVVGEQAGQARDAAMRQDLPGQFAQFVSDHQAQIPLFNWIGLGIAGVLLAINLAILTIRRRYTRG